MAELAFRGRMASKAMWRLCIEDDEANRTVVNLVRKEYTIGRAEENAVRLTERNVSRAHAVLRRTDDGWTLQDLESHTGCYINDRPIEDEQLLQHRDRVRIGDYDITLLDSEREAEEHASDDQTETVPATAEADEALERHDRLVIVEGPNPGTQYPLLDKRLLIGRGEECDLALPDTSVSRVHATLLKDEHGRYHISDQQSSNGVRVNGMEVTKIPLYSGDVVELGDVHLQFVPKGSRFDARALSDKPADAGPAKGGSKKWLWAALVVAAAGGVMWVGGRHNIDREPEPLVTAEASLLTQAQAHLERSDLTAAHALLHHIPESSPERQSPLFRSIASAWADQQFELAEMSEDRATQMTLLQKVANDALVDSRRKERAAAQLALLAEVAALDDVAMFDSGVGDGITPGETATTDEASVPPSTPPAVRKPTTKPATEKPAPQKPAPQKPAAPQPVAKPATTTATTPAPKPAPAPAPQPATTAQRPTTSPPVTPAPAPAPVTPATPPTYAPTPPPPARPPGTAPPSPIPTPAPMPRPAPPPPPTPGASPPVTAWPTSPAPTP